MHSIIYVGSGRNEGEIKKSKKEGRDGESRIKQGRVGIKAVSHSSKHSFQASSYLQVR